MSTEQEKFSHHAKNWSKDPEMISMTKSFEKGIRERIKINKDLILLDLGCGPGLLGMSFINELKKVIFLDFSEGMINEVKNSLEEKNIKNYELKLGEIESYNDEKVDLVTISMVLHHIKDIGKTIKKISTILNKGGKMIITDLDKAEIFGKEEFQIHHHGFNRDELSNIIKNNGFNNVKVESFDTITWKGTKANRFILIAEI